MDFGINQANIDCVYDNRLRWMWHRGALSGMDGMRWYPGGVRYKAPYGSVEGKVKQTK